MALLGVRGGLSVDHLVWERKGARFAEPGGPGLFAVLGARLVAGVDVRLATELPSDDPRFAELFTRHGIDHRYCTVGAAATRLWILNSNEGRRIVETASRSAIEIEGEGSDGDEQGDPETDARFFAGLDALLDSSPLIRAQVDPRTATGVDPHQGPMRLEGLDYLRRVVRPGGVVLPSRVQLALIDSDARAAARRIAFELATPVIARLDREGMLVVDPDDPDDWEIHDSGIHVVETTGAGDSSAAAIMAAIALGADLRTAAMFGVAVARIAVSDWGASGLLRAEQFTVPPDGVTASKERRR